MKLGDSDFDIFIIILNHNNHGLGYSHFVVMEILFKK